MFLGLASVAFPRVILQPKLLLPWTLPLFQSVVTPLLKEHMGKEGKLHMGNFYGSGLKSGSDLFCPCSLTKTDKAYLTEQESRKLFSCVPIRKENLTDFWGGNQFLQQLNQHGLSMY